MTKFKTTCVSALVIAALASSGAALAQQHGGHGGHTGHGTAAGTSRDTAATTAFKAANAAMHKGMDIPYSGNVDVDFVRGMIPHHQGAIDMAKIMLAHGKDPALKALATSIIADQEKEIATMQAWLKVNAR